MKANMKKTVKAFFAIVLSAVLVFGAWGKLGVALAGNLEIEDAGGNEDEIIFGSQTKEDGYIGTAMPESIDSASQETDYYIESLEQFNNFQAESKSNTFAGLTIHLAANVELDASFTGIGSEEYPFAGTFNGHGYAITKLSSTTNGLFVKLEGATIKKLVIGSAKISLAEAATNVGVLANEANGATVENVVVASSKITAGAVETSAIGGMIGKVSGAVSITGSDVKRLIIKTEGTTSAVGGFVGLAAADLTMNLSDVANSYIKSASTGSVSYLGGVIGQATAVVTATSVDVVAVNIQTAGPVEGIDAIIGYSANDASSFEGCEVNVTNVVTP